MDDSNKLRCSAHDEKELSKELSSLVEDFNSEHSGEDGKKANKKIKKKQPHFLLREIHITNPEEVEVSVLLDILLRRSSKAQEDWMNRANTLRSANSFLLGTVLCIQAVHLFVIHNPDCFSLSKMMSTILPALTSGLIAAQQKLSWGKKSSQAKKNAIFYNKIHQHVLYRMNMMEAGGKVDDVVKLWNVSMLTEASDIPPPIFSF